MFPSEREGKTSRSHNVDFDMVPTIHEIPNIEDLSPAEIADVWFTINDFQKRKKSDQRLVRRIRGGANVPPSEARGLEKRSPIACMEKRVAIMNGIAAVLNEQSRQKSLGEVNDEAIRECYQDNTTSFSSQALLRGAKDANEAREGLGEKILLSAADNIAEECSSTEGNIEIQSSPLLKRKSNGIFNTGKVFRKFLMRASSIKRMEGGTHEKKR